MLCCIQCLTSPALQAKFRGHSSSATCGLCDRPDSVCLPASAFGAEFGWLVSRYGYGSYNSTFGLPDRDEPVVTLAERVDADGIMVFASAVSMERRNDFLDEVRSADDKQARPARGRWKAASFGCRGFLDPDDYWISFKLTVERYRRYALKFGERGMPDFPTVLATTNPAFLEIVPPERIFYRARLHDLSLRHRAPTAEELGAPPSEMAKGGRANAAGISVLYTAESEKTAISEIRPHIGSMVAVGRCIARQPLNVFDLATTQRVRGLDPFATDFHSHERDAKFLSILNEEFARPLALHVPDQEYAPTQIVAELIANQGYDGIKYGSAMAQGGFNYVFFFPQLFRTEYLHSVAINSVAYTYTEQNPDPLGLHPTSRESIDD